MQVNTEVIDIAMPKEELGYNALEAKVDTKNMEGLIDRVIVTDTQGG